MRIMGQGLGPGLTIVATRKSVIRNAEGLELVLTPLGYASRGSPSRRAAPSAPAEVFRTSRRLIGNLLIGQSALSRASRKQGNVLARSIQQFSESGEMEGGRVWRGGSRPHDSSFNLSPAAREGAPRHTHPASIAAVEV